MSRNSQLAYKTVRQLAELIRRGECSPPELVEYFIRQAEFVNPTINAIAERRYSSARGEAQDAIAAIANNRGYGALLGVPCTIKESIAVRGMSHTAGLLSRRNWVAPTHAKVTRQLVAAGAIPFATSNVPEMAMAIETENLIYGRTNNPHDPGRTAGGSTGGEAALIASGASPFGIGSDTGGSIRIPAAFCGVFAHKPSAGLTSLHGQFPIPQGMLSRLLLDRPYRPSCYRPDASAQDSYFGSR